MAALTAKAILNGLLVMFNVYDEITTVLVAYMYELVERTPR